MYTMAKKEKKKWKKQQQIRMWNNKELKIEIDILYKEIEKKQGLLKKEYAQMKKKKLYLAERSRIKGEVFEAERIISESERRVERVSSGLPAMRNKLTALKAERKRRYDLYWDRKHAEDVERLRKIRVQKERKGERKKEQQSIKVKDIRRNINRTIRKWKKIWNTREENV